MNAALFAEQINRLTRKKWASADELAQELLAIFKAATPVELDAPLTIKNRHPNSTKPALTIEQNPGQGDAGIKIKNADGSSGTLTASKAKGLTYTPDQKGTPKFPAKSTQSAGGGIPGKVKSGSGSTYTVDLYENGPSAGVTQTVSVTQLQIASGETIPAGTWAIVAKTGSVYSMQCPVWL